MVTPLGDDVRTVRARIAAGAVAAAAVTGFPVEPFACRLHAPVRDFRPADHIAETKLIRLMNRDAQLAVAAARRARADAGLAPGRDYPPEGIALFGAVGMGGLPLGEVAPLLAASVDGNGAFDLGRFGQDGLRAVSPLLSFKILGNMPLCFISISANIRGPNAIYTPWEGQGAQAIDAGWRAVASGEVDCAVVGGCDVRTHALAFVSLQQLGLFRSWAEQGRGFVPGEGAVFVVLESSERAAARGARPYARLAAGALGTVAREVDRTGTCARVWAALDRPRRPVAALVGCGNGDPAMDGVDAGALDRIPARPEAVVHPKRHTGDLFAAAAALQLGLGAQLSREASAPVLVNCCGHGSEIGAFLLEAA